eukprot:4056061-Pleurochrysis_carterae.AAC.2
MAYLIACALSVYWPHRLLPHERDLQTKYKRSSKEQVKERSTADGVTCLRNRVFVKARVFRSNLSHAGSKCNDLVRVDVIKEICEARVLHAHQADKAAT